ncbi:hypothetical protein AB205_0157570 [Aquarana catesbeiana]|uniref:C2H2-type domain-containing protein n=1 Tax=Aquarana catesbeiana TaxID=8400 RepID=A0A2G9RZM6_AQUCT|nr:hypothetical protein AB205_0157570 [Aquarana catesbeiana]
MGEVEGEEEERYVRDDQQSMEEDGITGTFIEEDTPTEISTGHAMEKPSKDLLTLSPGCKMEDENITGDGGGEKTMSSTMDGGLHSVDRPWNPSDSEQSRTRRVGARLQGKKTFSCPECAESFSSALSLTVHQRSHTGKKLFPCPECGKCFLHKSELVIHYRSHTGEKPYSCPECGKCFSNTSNLSRHRRSHKKKEPYSCRECGELFSRRDSLFRHQRLHTGKKSNHCAECGKPFRRKSSLVIHQRTHTGQKPYSCPECGKCFSEKPSLSRHQRSHTGEKPYGDTLSRHQRSHTGGRSHIPVLSVENLIEETRRLLYIKVLTWRRSCVSCPDCGKCFSEKSDFSTHQRAHTGGETLFLSPDLSTHQSSHSGKSRQCSLIFSRSFLRRHHGYRLHDRTDHFSAVVTSL